MKQRIANYTVVIEKQKRLGTNTPCYMAYVPILGIATEAATIEEAKKEIQSLIQFHLDSLAQEGEAIPIETDNTIIARSQAIIPSKANIAA